MWLFGQDHSEADRRAALGAGMEDGSHGRPNARLIFPEVQRGSYETGYAIGRQHLREALMHVLMGRKADV